jgi:gamma-glutamylcyclotransferase (GGCT)/AIG2-like uncharacterized protein YtfP
MPTHLFIYGTLHPDRAPAGVALYARRLTLIGAATIRARLYNLGAYPGLILDHDAPPVPGELFSVPDVETLAQLDCYEDFRPDDPAASLFLRLEATATTPNGAHHPCWVYVYNRSIPRSEQL